MKTELSDGEWNLMKALWDNAPMTITELTAKMKETTGWSKHTIISMLSRMESKGVVQYRKDDRAKLYFPVLKRDDAIKKETGHFLEKVFDGHLGVMLNAMVDSRALTQADIDELSAILEKAKEESSRD